MPKTILILAANPKDTDGLRLDEEVREIDAGLRRARKRRQFKLEQRWAVRPIDLRRALLDCEPEIVHFAGHGAGEYGIQLEDQTGKSVPVPSQDLADLFELFPKIECVFLNACYTSAQATAIVPHIDHVIGLQHDISDKAAVEFAVAFYDAVGAGKPYDFAFKFASNAMSMLQGGKFSRPVLRTKSEWEAFTRKHNQRFSYSKEDKKLKPTKSTYKNDNEIFADLLTGDFHYIRRAVDFISTFDRTVTFQEKLLERFSSPSVSYLVRLAIGQAFNIIGDPRDLDEMVLIPHGSYWLGSDAEYIQSMLNQRYRYFSTDETPLQRNTLPSYYISRYPVTNQQYYEFIEAMPGHPPPSHWANGTPAEELSNHPVTHVSWNDATAYAKWKGGRLPTEFEWEKAAKGNKQRIYPWGDSFDPSKCNVQLEIDGLTTTPVGVFLDGVSEFGIFDLAGNVWEWTASKHVPYPGNDKPDDMMSSHKYVIRGGSYYNTLYAARCSCRLASRPTVKYENQGFRIVIPGKVSNDKTEPEHWFDVIKSIFTKG